MILELFHDVAKKFLWIRELAKPKYKPFWNEAIETLSELNEQRRQEIELRDIPIAVSLRRHGEQGSLSRSTQEIILKIQQQTAGQKHYFEQKGGGNYQIGDEMLRNQKNRLTWGDAIAIEIALKAL